VFFAVALLVDVAVWAVRWDHVSEACSLGRVARAWAQDRVASAGLGADEQRGAFYLALLTGRAAGGWACAAGAVAVLLSLRGGGDLRVATLSLQMAAPAG
jgi:hypothetical protein